MDDLSKSPEIPMGLGMALASNPYAMNNFSHMTNAHKRDVIERTNDIESKNDMERFVQTLEQ
ncbi:MAG: hypothetical protein EOM51_05260 [Clostridia bacterium]|nr:hypothetical protein [Clostridia bacterium]